MPGSGWRGHSFIPCSVGALVCTARQDAALDILIHDIGGGGAWNKAESSMPKLITIKERGYVYGRDIASRWYCYSGAWV